MNKIIANVVKEQNVFKFTIDKTEGDFEIYYSISPDMKDKKLLIKEGKECFEVESPVNDHRLFFQVVEGENTSGVFSTRLVYNSSIDNFRDLGGYKTVDGRTVKWGYFYRTASLGNVKEEDRILLENMGIKTIFDFRSKAEVLAEQDIELKGCKYINESGIITMDEQYGKEENFDMNSLMMELLGNTEKLHEMERFFLDGYDKMVEHNGAFKILFDTLKNDERLPLIFHCTAGKDRTGVAGALILFALGVDEKTVIEDYCLSNIYREKTNNEQINKIRKYINDEKLIEVLKAFFEVKEEYLMVTLNSIKKKYNSYEEYIINDLGMTKEELEKFRDKYLY